MKNTPRMTARAGASISFGLGSFILMADITAAVLRNGSGGGTVFDMGFPSILGWCGVLLWVAGIILLVLHRLDRGKMKRSGDRVRSFIVRGKDTFKCPKCGAGHDISGVDYHERFSCECGSVYDLYPERTEGR